MKLHPLELGGYGQQWLRLPRLRVHHSPVDSVDASLPPLSEQEPSCFCYLLYQWFVPFLLKAPPCLL